MKGKQQRSRFDRRGFVSEIVVGKITKSKLAIASTLPEKIRFNTLSHGLGQAQQFARRRGRIAQENIGRFDLDALAGGRLDLQRAVVVGQDRGRLEGAVFFENKVHRRDYNPQYSSSCGNNSAKWVKL